MWETTDGAVVRFHFAISVATQDELTTVRGLAPWVIDNDPSKISGPLVADD